MHSELAVGPAVTRPKISRNSFSSSLTFKYVPASSRDHPTSSEPAPQQLAEMLLRDKDRNIRVNVRLNPRHIQVGNKTVAFDDIYEVSRTRNACMMILTRKEHVALQAATQQERDYFVDQISKNIGSARIQNKKQLPLLFC